MKSILQLGKFYPPHMGGIETHLETLSRALSNDFSLSVLVASSSRAGRQDIVDGIPVTRCASTFSLSSAPICPDMARRIAESKADLVHLHTPNPTAVLAYLASGRSGPLVITHHSDVVRQQFLGRIYQPFYNRLLRQSNAIIATSDNYLNSSQELRPFRPKCQVIPYGIETTQFNTCSAAEIAAIHQKYGPNLIVAVGRLVYYKGFEYLVQAMPQVNSTLIIIGEGPMRPQLEQWIQRLGLQQKVTLTGELQNSQTAAFYHAAKLMILPSVARSEAFGIVQIEVMACGTPVINTSLDSGVPSVSLHGKTGLTVAPGKPAALAQSINTLLNDHSLREQFGLNALRRAADLFSVVRMRDTVSHLYEQVLEGRPLRFPTVEIVSTN